MRVRPTRGTLAALVAAVLLNLLTRATGDAWLALASAAVLALVVTSLLLRPPLAQLEVTVLGPGRVAVGSLAQQTVRVRNGADRPAPTCLLTHRSAGFEDAQVVVPPLSPGQQVDLPLVRRAVQRGSFHPAAELVSTAPYGVLRCSREVTCPEELVHPVPLPAPSHPSRGAVGVGAPTGASGVGLEILGLRPWRPGDSARGVSARASARHGRPFVLEREQERPPARTLVVIAVGGSTGPGWERSVSSAAGLVLQALEEGSRVRLVAGEGVPAPRVLDREAVLDFFARVDAAAAFGDAERREAARAAHPGGTVVLLLGSRSADQPELGCTCCEQVVLR